ncbi:porin family protein [Ferruginibacter sp. SUN106]|uniref:porin family protein n=1 Tax=Ferruginibacter sp. SUN106 TaxID=2978348 RepID=UPI003D359E26
MKKYVTVAIAAILITATATAQKANIGIKAGLNVSNIHNDNDVKYDTKTGVHVGLIGHFHLSKEFAIQPEIVYSQQGAKYTIANVESTLKLDYINVPVMFQYMFDNGLRLQAGPQVGFLASAKADASNGPTADVKNDFKSVDFAVGVGAGYLFVPTGFGIDARYNLGLSDIRKNISVQSTNRGFQLGVFYLFGK